MNPLRRLLQGQAAILGRNSEPGNRSSVRSMRDRMAFYSLRKDLFVAAKRD